jgi:hypothetical protein
MTARNIFATCLLLGLGVLYCWMNDWFRQTPIQITPSIRPGRTSKLNPEVYPVTFMLDGKYRLTSIKVVSVADTKTNKFPRPLWHMISDTASQATKIIVYGAPLRGMKPSIPRARPEPLHPNIPYRLFIEAVDGLKGTVDFKTVEVVHGFGQQ